MGNNRQPASERRPSGGTSGGTLALLLHSIPGDLRHFSLRRALAVARLAVSEALRLHILGLLAIGLAAMILADLSTKRFDPLFETMPSLIHVANLTIIVIGMIVAIFVATYSLPREIASKTIYALVTKPVSRLEIILGKLLGIMAVLAFITFGLGALAYGYMEVRAGQLKTAARARAESLTRDGQSVPLAVARMAAEGPLQAANYVPPSEPLTLVAREGRSEYDWLSGYYSHRASWAFDGLPVEELASGRARLIFQLALKPIGDQPLPESRRQILVRLTSPNGAAEWSSAFICDPTGRLEVPVPGRDSRMGFSYPGGRLWISLAGNGATELGLKADSCTLALADGRTIAATAGPLLTSAYSLNKFWIGGDRTSQKLMGRARFDLSAAQARACAAGAIVRVDVAVPSATNVPPGTGGAITIVNDQTLERQVAAFRPERNATVLVALPPGFCTGGRLSVYVQPTDPKVELGMNDESIKLSTGSAPFAFNYAKGLTMLWLVFCLFAAIGILAGTVAGWQVASMLTAVMLVVAVVWPAVIKNVTLYGVSVSGVIETRGAVDAVLTDIYRYLFTGLGWLLPDLSRLDYADLVAAGVNVPLGQLLGLPGGALWQALAYLAAVTLLAYAIFLPKEVAR